MNSREMLLSLIDRYILEEADRRRQYNDNQVMIDLYEEVLKILKGDYQEIKDNSLCISILFDTIYHNDIYYEEFYSLLLRSRVDSTQRREFKKFVWKINSEMEQLKKDNDELKRQIDNNKHTVSSANKAKLCFKYNDPIKDNRDIYAIKRIVSYYELAGVIDNKEELLMINEIELHNRNVAVRRANSKKYGEYAERLYERIPNILQAGFQEHDEIQVLGNRKGTLDKFVKEIIATIKDMGSDEIEYVIESYKKYKIDDNEYNDIINGVMNSYVSDLLVFYQYLLDKEVYSDRSERNQVVKEYYMILDKYLWIRSYYEKINEIDLVLVDNDNNDELYCDDSNDKQLIFAHSNVNISKSRIISDMGSVPHEYYERVYELINGLKKNTLKRKEVTSFTSINRDMASFFELRDDQIRIIVKHMDSDIYCIMGVFVKKSDNLRSAYKSMVSRELPNISSDDKKQMYIELGKKDMEELEEFVSNNKRKGTR